MVVLGGVVGLAVVTPALLPAGTLRMARGLPSVILSRFFLNAAFSGSITYVPLMFTQERGASLTTAGVVLALGSLGWSAGSWVQGHPSMRGRRASLVSVGGLFLSLGCLAMVVIAAADWSVWLFAPAMVSAATMPMASATWASISFPVTSPMA